jgi:inner membrane protein COX18
VTMLAPPLVQIPILMTAILTIRDACQRSLESLPPTAASSSYSESALSHLHDLATTSFLWCPSLALPDPQLLLPLFAGVAFLANVELGAKARAAVMLSVRAGEADRERDSDRKRKVTQKEALERRSRDAITQWEMNRKGSRSFSAASIAYLSKEIDSARKLNGNERTKERETTAEGFPREDKDRTNRIITNALRVASVALIPVFAAAPAVRLILPSNSPEELNKI